MKISIITATYNSVRTLRDTMNSVLNQNYQNFEHIIIDGNSTDDTLRIVKEFEPRYHGKLKWLSEPDKGIYDAMNKGIQMATGEVVGFLNSDDFFYSPNSLDMVVKGLDNPKVDAVYADNIIVDCNDTSKIVRRHINSDFKISQMKCGFMPSHPTFYCRKEIFERYGLFDINYKIAADFDWLFRTLYINRITALYQPGFFTNMRSGGISQGGVKSHLTVVKEHLDTYRKYGLRANILSEIYRLGYKYICKLLRLSY